jgi:hypothetical protein
VIIISSVEDVQVEFEIVHRKVALDPVAKPVTVVAGELAVVIVAVPETKLQAPVPVVGVLAAIVKVLLAH